MNPDDTLDAAHIASAAAWAAVRLLDGQEAKVRLAPGDMTEYRILIAPPGTEWAYGDEREGRYYWVTLCANFGAGYEWHGGRIDGGYAAEKWTNPGSSKATRAWTGEVVARFLSATAVALGTQVPA